MTLNEKLKLDASIAEQAGFTKPKRTKQSVATLGAKHASRVAIDRTVKGALGNGLLGSIASLIARDTFKKATK